jgi:phosphatidate cytidylyltransferase
VTPAIGPGRKATSAPASSDLPKRLGSALVLAAIGLGAVVASPWTFAALIAGAGAAVTWEWSRLVRGRDIDPAMATQGAAVAAVAFLVTLRRPELAAIALALGLAGIAVATRGKARFWSLFGLIYTAVPAWALVLLRSDPTHGIIAVLYVISIAILTDTASYAGGRLLGGPKLAPRISPQKTWSGLIVGLAVPTLAGFAFAPSALGTSPYWLAFFSLILAAACQIGDLTESAIKRRFGVKDMSGIIPGHGGVLDRIDGLLFAALAAAAIVAFRGIDNPGQALLLW